MVILRCRGYDMVYAMACRAFTYNWLTIEAMVLWLIVYNGLGYDYGNTGFQ